MPRFLPSCTTKKIPKIPYRSWRQVFPQPSPSPTRDLMFRSCASPPSDSPAVTCVAARPRLPDNLPARQKKSRTFSKRFVMLFRWRLPDRRFRPYNGFPQGTAAEGCSVHLYRKSVVGWGTATAPGLKGDRPHHQPRSALAAATAPQGGIRANILEKLKSRFSQVHRLQSAGVQRSRSDNVDKLMGRPNGILLASENPARPPAEIPVRHHH